MVCMRFIGQIAEERESGGRRIKILKKGEKNKFPGSLHLTEVCMSRQIFNTNRQKTSIKNGKDQEARRVRSVSMTTTHRNHQLTAV